MSLSIASEFLFFNHPNTFLSRNLRPLKEGMITSASGVPLNFEQFWKGPFKRRHQHSGEPLSESPPQSGGSSKPAGLSRRRPLLRPAVASPGGGGEDSRAQGWGSDALASPSLPRNPSNRFGSRFLNQAGVCLCDLLLHLPTLSRDLRRWRGLVLQMTDPRVAPRRGETQPGRLGLVSAPVPHHPVWGVCEVLNFRGWFSWACGWVAGRGVSLCRVFGRGPLNFFAF